MPFPPITTSQQFLITPVFLTSTGKPATVDGIPTYASSNEAAASVVAAPDGLSATVVAHGVGDYTVSMNADADLGPGIRTIVAQDTGSVTLGEAATASFNVGPVVEQP